MEPAIKILSIPADEADPPVRQVWRRRPTRRVLASFVCLAAASVSSTGCVKYIPVELGAAPPEEEVRVRLSNEGAIRAARHLGRITPELDAAVEPHSPDSIAVIVWLGKNYPGTLFADVRETIILPRHEVNDLHLRRLSVPRTIAAFAGAAVVFGVLVDHIFFQEDPNAPPPPDDDNPPPATLTLFRIGIGRTP